MNALPILIGTVLYNRATQRTVYQPTKKPPTLDRTFIILSPPPLSSVSVSLLSVATQRTVFPNLHFLSPKSLCSLQLTRQSFNLVFLFLFFIFLICCCCDELCGNGCVCCVICFFLFLFLFPDICVHRSQICIRYLGFLEFRGFWILGFLD